MTETGGPEGADRPSRPPGPSRPTGPEVRVRRADERDLPTLAALRRTWAAERGQGAADADPGFEQGFAAWWRTEQPRRSFWLAEVGDARVGITVVGSLNVAEVVSMPAPGHRSERWGYVGNLVVIEAAARSVPRLLLSAAIAHAHERGFQRLVLRPSVSGAAFYRAAGFRSAGDDMVVLETGGRRRAGT